MGLPDIENIPETGAVFTIGRSRFADNVASHFFIRKDPVVDIACGDEHSAVICQSGRLFVFGSNDWGQLGLGHKNHVSKPSCVKILKPEKVTHVACGRAHTLICTENREIYACGSDQEGQLGRGNNSVGDSSSSPVMVYDAGLAGPGVVQVEAGSHHSMLLLGNGDVVVWGSNLEGQLGLAGISGLLNKPTKVPLPEPIKQISAGYYHSAFLTESGVVYICGESESGKLGIDVNFSSQVAPKQMQLPCRAARVACGGHHTLVLDVNGSVHCTGSNANGQLGMGSGVTDVQLPKILDSEALRDEKVVKIVTGESHSAILTESGKLYTCGDGRHGKLGLEENENNVHDLAITTKYLELFITSVACGGCHTILVGHRRENSEGAQTEPASQQTDNHVNKKNLLPPLKLPINLPHSEHRAESNESEKNETTDTMNMKEAMSNVQSEMQNVVDGAGEKLSGIVESGKDRLTKMKNEAESEARDAINKGKEALENCHEQLDKEMKEIESNIAAMLSSEKTEEKHEEPSEDAKSNGSDKKIDGGSENSRENSAMGKNSDRCTPPPKPPRASLENSEKDATSEKSNESAATVHNKEMENAKTEDENEKEATSKPEKNEMGTPVKNESNRESSPHESASSQKSHSVRSNTKSDETIEANEKEMACENNDEKENENKKEDENTNQDDADVVQSPAPRTGKIAKIFKGIRQHNVSNGTKASSNTNLKSTSKSKTCTLL